jgi:DNA repair photolyase
MKGPTIQNINSLRRGENRIEKGSNRFKLRLENPLSLIQKKRLLAIIKMGTREWAKKEVNCIKGCSTYCLYCYAKGIAKHYKRCIEETWKDMEINWRAVNKGYGKIRKKGPQPFDVMFPTSHNITYEEPYFSACVIVLKKILDSGNSVLVTIKPSLKVVERLCNLFSDYKNLLTFRFTIGSISSTLLKVIETNAPSFEERIKALKYATNKGFNTSISIEPLLDPKPFDLIKRLEHYLSPLDYKKDLGTIWIGLLKTQYIPVQLRMGDIEKYLSRIKQKAQFENVYTYYEELYHHPRIKWKESITKMMIMNDIKVKELTS